MTAPVLEKPITEDDLKIWGWYSSDDDFVDRLTKANAAKQALSYKEQCPGYEVVVFKMVSTAEIQTYLKGV